MIERIHKNKKYLSLFYDKCDTLIENYSDEEIGAIMRAAITYELTGEKKAMSERVLQVTVNSIFNDIDLSTANADKKSETNSRNRRGKTKSNPYFENPEEDPDFESVVNGTYKKTTDNDR